MLNIKIMTIDLIHYVVLGIERKDDLHTEVICHKDGESDDDLYSFPVSTAWIENDNSDSCKCWGRMFIKKNENYERFSEV